MILKYRYRWGKHDHMDAFLFSDTGVEIPIGEDDGNGQSFVWYVQRGLFNRMFNDKSLYVTEKLNGEDEYTTLELIVEDSNGRVTDINSLVHYHKYAELAKKKYPNC